MEWDLAVGESKIAHQAGCVGADCVVKDPYKTSDKTSFASVSAETRWPTIITSAIDDVHVKYCAIKGIEKPSENALANDWHSSR